MRIEKTTVIYPDEFDEECPVIAIRSDGNGWVGIIAPDLDTDLDLNKECLYLAPKTITAVRKALADARRDKT